MSEAPTHPDAFPAASGSTTIKLPESYLRALGNRFTTDRLADLLASTIKPTFFYGSLMLPDHLDYVLRGKHGEYAIAARMTPAVLYKHHRFGLYGLSFPAVLPSQHDADTVSGVVLFGITKAQQEYLDRYEAMYTRTAVQVEVELLDGRKVMIGAEVYIWTTEVYMLIPREDFVWSIEHFVGSTVYPRESDTD
ncbi:hypothetical protein MMC26_003361 [Xylographa opegraphella]|nr:hypothetical protein [Xylographa opegraphella]